MRESAFRDLNSLVVTIKLHTMDLDLATSLSDWHQWRNCIAKTEGPDQTTWRCRLILIFVECKVQKNGFRVSCTKRLSKLNKDDHLQLVYVHLYMSATDDHYNLHI